MHLTRRRLVTAAGTAGIGGLAGCLGGGAAGEAAEASSDGAVARSSFFVFGDLTARVAGDTATAELLVPVGQHGHGWEPGPRIREEIRGADLFVHGMPGFQPWVDAITRDLAADGADVTTVDASTGIDLFATGSGHDHGHEGAHDEHADEETRDHASEEAHDDHGDGADPHFWMDPLRVKDAVGNVRRGLTAVDEGNADVYAENADTVRARLDDLHDRIASAVVDGSTETILVAGHNAHRYLADRYGLDVVSLTDASPDDRPTARDVERARRLVDDRDLRYVCADPLESQRAAEQLVAETGAEAVLPLTAMPGLTDEWDANDWGYVDVMEHVNLPTLERVLDA
ncbi:zinc ABC transporter substrate-binding protein [Haloplanus rubicundus]|uniref:Zinc ABC transporter substrate-binding protein n=1 Tax=Haloplanus rubicundus TaxID=1547898 RepID=A0A345DZP8_9EURY|nr:metal ABC transporter substrate-binding protein [Haloplanus rubicundus]AXG05420.1 zinc ABC transporter substrate-binding protein [Haloplanus rubicundus]